MYDGQIILDFEMNPVKTRIPGNRHFRSEIIQIGAVRLDEQYREVGRFQTYVRPEYNFRIEPEIIALTGITFADVVQAPVFSEAVRLFSEWVGDDYVRVSSWSDTDYWQLSDECDAKDVEFPMNLCRWIDLQKIFPRMMHIPGKDAISLADAVAAMGMKIDCKHQHDALYDAVMTSKIQLSLMTGEYRTHARKVRESIVPAGTRMTSSLADLCPQLQAYLQDRKAV